MLLLFGSLSKIIGYKRLKESNLPMCMHCDFKSSISKIDWPRIMAFMLHMNCFRQAYKNNAKWTVISARSTYTCCFFLLIKSKLCKLGLIWLHLWSLVLRLLPFWLNSQVKQSGSSFITSQSLSKNRSVIKTNTLYVSGELAF